MTKIQDLMVRTSTIDTSGGRTGLWIVPDVPFWFVPGQVADLALQRCGGDLSEENLAAGIRVVSGCSAAAAELEAKDLSGALLYRHPGGYTGRKGLEPSGLSEIWFHLTDACNLRCSHCLFGTSPSPARRSMERDLIKETIREARGLGCSLVCFTGGEPFLYPDFIGLLKWVLEFEDLRVAILTNGLLADTLITQASDLDISRIHLQVSLDGPRKFHDAQRGRSTFDSISERIRNISDAGIPVSIAMAVNMENVEAAESMPAICLELGVRNIHYQYHINRGLGRMKQAARGKILERSIIKAYMAGKAGGVSVDNVESIRSQVFTPPGTRFDLGNAAWQSLAIGPDGMVFPTPALVDKKGLCAGDVRQGLERLWRQSEVLKQLRNMSLLDSKEMASDPYRFLTGGGDIDQAVKVCRDGKQSLGRDTYAPLYGKIAETLI